MAVSTINEAGLGIQAYGNRNLIINGDMRIAQRGTSTTGITSAGYYTVDRIKMGEASSGTWTMSQSTDVPVGFSKSVKLECTVANASPTSNQETRIGYLIEGQDLQHLDYGSSGAKTLNLSFWVKSNKTGTGALWFYMDDGGRSSSPSYTINAADTWEYKSIAINPNTVHAITGDNTSGLRVHWYLSAGSSYIGSTANSWVDAAEPRMTSGDINFADTVGNEFYLTGVQLEVGDTATPFEHRSYGQELALCQRYYEVGSTYISRQNNDTLRTETTDCQFSVTKRSAPTMTNTNSSSGNVSVADITASNTNSWRRRHRSTSTNDFSNQWNWKADAEL